MKTIKVEQRRVQVEMIPLEVWGDVPLTQIESPSVPQVGDRIYVLGFDYKVEAVNYVFKDCIFDFVSLKLGRL